ncbi:MAG: DUF1800 domain-containing protein [Thermoanaerobaculia bacterium]
MFQRRSSGMRFRTATAPLLLGGLLLAAPAALAARDAAPYPWRAAGLDERQAAAHLLDRFAFGARPGEIDDIVATGLENWFERQLAGAVHGPASDPALERRLATLDALTMSAREIQQTFPDPGLLRREAIEAGVITEAELAEAKSEREQRALYRRVEEWGRGRGYRSQRVLLGQLMAAKLLRAVYSGNQLGEVLADFWFNHFNVSLTNNLARGAILSYERDAVRPFVAGRFRDLLGATAKHPAMLAYLDNFRSVAPEGAPTTIDREIDRFASTRRGRAAGASRRAGMEAEAMRRRVRSERARAEANPNRPQGLNENYARELLELHTLGVDGGYTQEDVVAVARAFTGWSFVPPGAADRARVRTAMERVGRAGGLGFVADGAFPFRADAHDAGAKRVLGVAFPAGRGIEDGEQVLDLVAAHPATARHLAQKLAVRFVADEPPPELVARLAATLRDTGGDLAATLRVLVAAPEFWAPAVHAAKIKSPLELVASSLRALDAEVSNPFPLLGWLQRMGEPLYAYQAPTGYPDRADFWVNTGALLVRMNYGLELASGRIGGVRFDLAARAGGREPASTAEALATYAALLLPGRDSTATVARLTPMAESAASPALAGRIADRAPPGDDDPLSFLDAAGGDATMEPRGTPPDRGARRGADGGDRARDPFARGALASRYFPAAVPMARAGEVPTTVAGIAGLVLGSPEFQRR